VRLEIKKTGVVKGKGGDQDITGNLVRVKVAKNKLAPPFRTADFELTYGAGVSRSGEVVDLGLASGVLGRSGAWYVFSTPEAAAAVNAALAAPASGSGGRRGAVPATAPTRASDILANLSKAKGKGAKGGAKKDSAAAANEAEAEAAAAATAAGPATPSDSDTQGASTLDSPVTPGAPFAQGRDKAKAWFEARPAAMEAVGLLIRAALKSAPIELGKAAATAEAPISAVGAIDARLPGAAIDEEEALFGDEGKA
jgi:hypothetical protein